MLELIAWSGQYDRDTPVSAAFVKRIREGRSELMAEILDRGR
jgi:hypothetical protein